MGKNRFNTLVENLTIIIEDIIMNKLKMALAVGATLFATSAIAAHVTQPLHHKMVAPKASKKAQHGVIMGIDWLFLEPSNYASQYAFVSKASMNPFNGNSSLYTSNKVINSGLQGAFHLYAGLANIGNNTSVQVGWTHLDTMRADSLGVANTSPYELNTITDQNGNTAKATHNSIFARSKYEYNAVDLTFTKTMHHVGKLNWQLLAGIRYAEIDHDLDSVLQASESFPIFNGQQIQDRATALTQYHTKFQGFGPRLGLNANYDIYHGIKVFGQVAVSLLYSKLDDHDNLTDVDTISSPFGQESASILAKSQIFNREGVEPNVDAQVGLSYDHPFHGAILGIRAGYQVDWYHDATAQLDSFGQAHLENVSFAGPFVGLVLHGL